MREAYSLLRQSIIHVEHDNIDFDEEELAGERPRQDPQADADADADADEDTQMSIDESQEDESQQTAGAAGSGSTTGAIAGTSSSQQPGTAGAVPAQAPAKRRMVITHDKYISLQSLIVHYLAGVENETGKGIDRDELIDWYLESKEDAVQDVDELEYEKELMTKMLRKLVKVC